LLIEVEEESVVEENLEPTFKYDEECLDIDCFIGFVETEVNVKGEHIFIVDFFGVMINTSSDLFFEVIADDNYAFKIDQTSGNYFLTSDTITELREDPNYINLSDSEIEESYISQLGPISLYTNECTFQELDSFVSVMNNWNTGMYSSEDFNFADCELTFK
jgi:hypothetical protein